MGISSQLKTEDKVLSIILILASSQEYKKDKFRQEVFQNNSFSKEETKIVLQINSMIIKDAKVLNQMSNPNQLD